MNSAQTGLYRPQALAARGRPRLGRALLVQPLSSYWLAGLALTAIALLGLVLTLGTWPRRTTVVGTLVPDKGLLQVVLPPAREVVDVLVSEGNAVRAGDVLARLRSAAATTTAPNPNAALADELQREQARLAAELVQLEGESAAQRAAVTTEQDAKRRQRAALFHSLEAERQALGHKQQERTDLLPLVERGVVARNQQRALDMDLAERESRVRTLEAAVSGLDAELAQLDGQLSRLTSERTERQRRVEAQQAEVRRELVATGPDGLEVVRAPVDGTVSAVLVHAGDSTRPGTAFTLLPKASTLVAELYVPSSGMSYARPGHEAVLKFDAYPYQLFGVQRARLISRGLAPVTGAQLSSRLEPGQYFYRAVAHVETSLATPAEGEISLVPGMQFQADIIAERRPLYQWLLAPLFRDAGTQ